MRSTVCRRSLTTAVAQSRPSLSSHQARSIVSRRTFAEKADVTGGVDAAPQKGSKLPLIAAGALVFSFPLYYILHSDKPAGSGQAARKEARRNGDPSQETRDPRDSDVKTLGQKREKEAREGR